VTDAHFICSFISADSSVVPDMLIDLLLNLLHSIIVQNVHQGHLSALLWIFLPIRKLPFSSYSKHHI